MIYTRIKVIGKSIRDLQIKLSESWAEFQPMVEELGEEVRNYMIQYIASHKVREDAEHPRPGSLQSLEEGIKCYKLGGFGKASIGFGIGNIEELNQFNKYWAWINYGVAGTGRKSPPADYGYFEDGTPPIKGSGQGQNWQHTGNTDDYLMIPRKALPAMRYIENTESFLDVEFSKLINDLKKALEK